MSALWAASQQAQDKGMNGPFFPWQSHLVDCLLLSPLSMVSGPWQGPDLQREGKRQALHLLYLPGTGPPFTNKCQQTHLRSRVLTHAEKHVKCIWACLLLHMYSRLAKRSNVCPRQPEALALRVQFDNDLHVIP